MSRRGDGIRKRIDGRWEGRYTVMISSEKKYKSVYARSYAEVKEKLQTAKENEQARRERIDSETHSNDRTILFREAAQEWLEHIGKERRHSTLVKYYGIYSKYLSVLNSYRLSDLTQNHIDEVFYLSENMESKQLQKTVSVTLNQILKFAGQKYEIHSLGYEKYIKIERKKTVEVFNRSEQVRLMTYLYEGEKDIYKIGILLCLCTGLRLGELCALKWIDIDCDMRILHVTSTVQRIAVKGYATKTALYEGAPKSECSLRDIPLPNELIMLLKKYGNKGMYVIKGSKPAEPRTYQNKLKKYLKEAGIDHKNFHVLRHTFATNCIESGMDVKSLSEILGHANVKITLNRYVHPSMEKKRQYINKLSAIYGQNLGHHF